MNSRFHIHPKVRLICTKLGSLLLLFQRSPIVQIIMPEARVMSTTGVGELVKWTVATVAGLGVYDTVAGATALVQIAPTPVVVPVPATSGSAFTMTMQVTGAPGDPGSWQVTGTLPTGIVKSNTGAFFTLSGTPTSTGSFPFTLTAWELSGNSGGSVSKAFTISVAAGAVVLPSVTTSSSASIATTSATLGGNVTSAGGGTITARGVVYSITATNANPLIGGAGVTQVAGTASTGVFTISATGLTPGTAYSFKAFATNSAGTTYTAPVATFNTLIAVPTITTPTNATITTTSVTLGGNVTNAGGGTITTRGVVYSVTASNADPLIGGAGVTQVPGTASTGIFTINATGLAPGTAYSFKAYATNSAGTTYTAPVTTFNTLIAVPTITTPTNATITTTSATLGGNVTNAGGGTITARGVVYSVTASNADPLIGGTGVTQVAATASTGVFTISATGLAPGTTYSFKAYATNSAGTTYTTPVATFNTVATAPTVTAPTSTPSASVSNTSPTTSATLGGTVMDDGGATITERGVVYSLTSANMDPLINGANVNKLATTGTTGVFTVSAIGLSKGTDYSFKAYATNSMGTTYSSPVSTFLTLADPLGTFTTWQGSQFNSSQMADPAISGPTADPDGDGITNENEYILGLSPLNRDPSPAPAISPIARPFTLSFLAKSASGSGYAGKTRHYALEATDSLSVGSWTPPVGYSDVIASDQTVTYSESPVDPAPGSAKFYRLKVWLAP